MKTAKDIMATDLITVTPETEIIQAGKLLLENHINGMPVVDENGAMVGIICQSDLISQQKRLKLPSLFTLLDGFVPIVSLKRFDREVEKIAAATVGKAMTENPVAVKPDTGLDEIASLMVEKNFHSIPVVDDNGSLVGIIGKEDILKTMTAD